MMMIVTDGAGGFDGDSDNGGGFDNSKPYFNILEKS